MHWFLKCFYGYRNLWDEILFRWILDYIAQQFPDVQSLTIEVQDVAWMEHRYDTNKKFVSSFSLHHHFSADFFTGKKQLSFVELSKDIRDNFRYDIYFFGGWEVFAESRWFHGGRNYVVRYGYALMTKPFVLLGGIETPIGVRQKILYKYLLPKAHRIVCRDKVSYATALQYNPQSLQYQDFAITIIKYYRQLTRHVDHMHHLPHKPYVLVNMISSMATEESFSLIHRFLLKYSDHDIYYVHAWEEDRQYGERLIWAYPHTQIYDWTEHTLHDTLQLFSAADAGIGCRLHFLLLLQEFQKDRYALVYAEKVTKLITNTITFDSC